MPLQLQSVFSRKWQSLQQRSGADPNFDNNKCPPLDAHPFVEKSAQKDADSYDPTLVDWRSIIKSFEYLAAKEKRCAHFVDCFSHQAAGMCCAVCEGPGGAVHCLQTVPSAG